MRAQERCSRVTPTSRPMRETTSSAANAGALQGRLQRTLRRLSVEPPPLAYFTRQPWYPWLVVGLVSVGAFIGQLDATIVQLALPTLGKTFDASLEAVGWVSLAYLVAFASLVFLVLVLNQVSAWGPTSLMTLAFTISSAMLIWLLVRQERASSSPLVDLRLFRSTAFSCGVIAVVDGTALRLF